uniref:Peroxidase n=1 Tax=Phlebotomus papatasi TaxID=29031 RepID=A0A1B0DME5_PHLPP
MAAGSYSRLLSPKYGDRVSSPTLSVTGEELPNPRVLSVDVFGERDIPDPKFTLLNMQWGQVITHDLSLQFGGSQAQKHSTSCCSPEGHGCESRILVDTGVSGEVARLISAGHGADSGSIGILWRPFTSMTLFSDHPSTRECPKTSIHLIAVTVDNEDTEEGWTCQSTGHVSLQRSTNSEINVLGTRVVSSEFLNVSWRNEIQEIFESCGSLESTELSEVIVTGETVISIPLDIDRLQVLSNWIVQSEQEVLDLSSRKISVKRRSCLVSDL